MGQGGVWIAALLIATTAAGCSSTPQEREIARIRGEVDEYLERDETRREELRERYEAARARIENRRALEIEELLGFRTELLDLVKANQRRTVLDGLSRMRTAADQHAKRLSIRAQMDRMEEHYEALLREAGDHTDGLIAVRSEAREEQAARLLVELRARERALDDRRDAYVAGRLGAIQAINGLGVGSPGVAVRQPPAAPAPAPAPAPAIEAPPAVEPAEPAAAPARIPTYAPPAEDSSVEALPFDGEDLSPDVEPIPAPAPAAPAPAAAPKPSAPPGETSDPEPEGDALTPMEPGT